MVSGQKVKIRPSLQVEQEFIMILFCGWTIFVRIREKRLHAVLSLIIVIEWAVAGQYLNWAGTDVPAGMQVP